MAVFSMTGYGRGAAKKGGSSATCEVKSVNNRYLDVNVRAPRGVLAFEPRLRDLVQQTLSRGRVDLFIELQTREAHGADVHVDEQLARRYLRRVRALQKSLNVPGAVEIRDVLAWQGVLVFTESETDAEVVWPLVEEAAKKALKGLVATRKREGEALRKELSGRLRLLRTTVRDMEEEIPRVASSIEDRVRLRITTLQTVPNVDADRLAQEVAFHVARADVTEEMVRLTAHIDHFESALAEPRAEGKRLDFLLQEMHREITTYANKLQGTAVSRHVIEAKSLAEKLREQVQNIE
ncbi:YicC family protein [bacterium]|nr:YicC family protein [bacterium]